MSCQRFLPKLYPVMNPFTPTPPMPLVLMPSRRWLSRSVGQMLLAGTAAVVAAVALPPAASAQSDACYMVTSSGQQLNLGQLCGEVNTPAPKVKSRFYRIKIKRRLAATPVVDVNFNGKSFEMIWDTGASSTLITQDMAKALRIKPSGYREVIVADGSILKFPVTAIKSVSAGGVTARNLEVTIANKADVGLLGHDFFGNYDVKIKRNVIELSPPTSD
jgi:predicted aspartyl protease